MKEHKEHLDIRLPLAEKQHLEEYCKAIDRTKSDVVREFIRNLEIPKHES